MAKNKKDDGAVVKIVGYVVSIILMFVIIFNFSRILFTSSTVSFSSFLNWLGSIDVFKINLNYFDLTITGDWSVFNFVKDFLNMFTSIFSVLIWLFSNILSLINFIILFLKFLFVGA